MMVAVAPDRYETNGVLNFNSKYGHPLPLQIEASARLRIEPSLGVVGTKVVIDSLTCHEDGSS